MIGHGPARKDPRPKLSTLDGEQLLGDNTRVRSRHVVASNDDVGEDVEHDVAETTPVVGGLIGR